MTNSIIHIIIIFVVFLTCESQSPDSAQYFQAPIFGKWLQIDTVHSINEGCDEEVSVERTVIEIQPDTFIYEIYSAVLSRDTSRNCSGLNYLPIDSTITIHRITGTLEIKEDTVFLHGKYYCDKLNQFENNASITFVIIGLNENSMITKWLTNISLCSGVKLFYDYRPEVFIKMS